MYVFKNLLRLFIDLRFAIILLILISIIIGIGSIIEQDQSLDYYINSYTLAKPALGIFSYPIIFFFGFNTVYRSWIFLGLIFCLGISLILCTSKQQLPNINYSRDLFFLKNLKSINKLPIYQKKILDTKNFFLGNNFYSLSKINFYIHQQKNTIYALKGLFGKIGPIIVHFSLVCILLGAFIGAFGKFTAQEFIPKGEFFGIQNTIGSGFFVNFPDFRIRLNDFWIEYSNQKIFQFYSNITILNSLGLEAINKTISVNHPLIYKNIVFYQTDWNLLGLRVETPVHDLIQVPLTLLNQTPKIWSTIINNDTFTDSIIVIIEDLRQKVLIYNNNGQFIQSISFGDPFFIGDRLYIISDLLYETGLQIKLDPSIFLIFLGFGLLMISTCLSYISYIEIWFYLMDNMIIIGSKNKINF